MRYKVLISYDGTNYLGFQSQPHKKTIQDEIEKAILKLLNFDTRIIMASRTDAGVHAKYQVFHFDIDKQLDVYKLKGGFNAVLPKDIHVDSVEEVDELTRKLQEKVYQEMGITLIGVGVYSYNTKNDEAGKIHNTVMETVMNHEWVLQLHGFFVEVDKKQMRFDVVMSFDIDWDEGLDILQKEVN